MNTYEITINGVKYLVGVGDVSSSPVTVTVNGEQRTVEFKEAAATAMPTPSVAVPVAEVAKPVAPAPAAAPKPAPAPTGAAKNIGAPMPGKILSIRVKLGDKVQEGDTVCTLEAMKMEMPISATFTGTVAGVHVNVGDTVAYNDPLVSVA